MILTDECGIRCGDPPCEHRIEDRLQVSPEIGQLVDNARRDLGVGRTGDDPVPFEASKTTSECVGTDAGQCVSELCEAQRAVKQLTDDESGPRSVEEKQEA